MIAALRQQLDCDAEGLPLVNAGNAFTTLNGRVHVHMLATTLATIPLIARAQESITAATQCWFADDWLGQQDDCGAFSHGGQSWKSMVIYSATV